jgi:hypothetical protein
MEPHTTVEQRRAMLFHLSDALASLAGLDGDLSEEALVRAVVAGRDVVARALIRLPEPVREKWLAFIVDSLPALIGVALHPAEGPLDVEFGG